MSEWRHVTPVSGGDGGSRQVRRANLWVIAAAVIAIAGGVQYVRDNPVGAGGVAPSWTVSANGQIPQPVDLPIQNISQETPVWCWAAVSQQIIASLRGPANAPPQCALVAMANGAPPQACCAGQNQACVRTGSLQQIQGLIQQYGGRPSAYAPPTDPMTLYNTLAQGHAVILALRLGQGAGHVVVVRGMAFQQTPQGVEPVLFVNDPMAYYTQPVPFRNLVNNWEAAIIVN